MLELGDVPWTWVAIRASGITAWGLLTAVVAYGLLLRTRLLGRGVAPPALLAMHRWLGVLAVLFLAAHVGFLLIDPVVPFTPVEVLVPFASGWRPVEVAAGIGAMWALLPVMIVARLRPKLGKRGVVWFRRSHIVAYFAWPLATLHYILAGTDSSELWALASILAGAGLVVFFLLVRGFVPKGSARRP